MIDFSVIVLVARFRFLVWGQVVGELWVPQLEEIREIFFGGSAPTCMRPLAATIRCDLCRIVDKANFGGSKGILNVAGLDDTKRKPKKLLKSAGCLRFINIRRGAMAF
jgi:hypothetical protein